MQYGNRTAHTTDRYNFLFHKSLREMLKTEKTVKQEKPSSIVVSVKANVVHCHFQQIQKIAWYQLRNVVLFHSIDYKSSTWSFLVMYFFSDICRVVAKRRMAAAYRILILSVNFLRKDKCVKQATRKTPFAKYEVKNAAFHHCQMKPASQTPVFEAYIRNGKKSNNRFVSVSAIIIVVTAV